MRRSTLLALIFLLALARVATAETLPKPIVDTADLRIHRIETACNTYLITCKKTGQFVVVDPGARIKEIVAANATAGRTLQATWLTHEHGDHLTGLAALLGKHAVPVVAHGKPGTVRVKQGSKVRVGALTWNVLHLPGHSPGSVGFLLPGRVLVGGDVLFRGSIGRSDLRTSDPKGLEKTLGVLWDLPEDVAVLPGHGATTTIGAEKKTNWLFQDFVRAGRGEAPIPRPWIGIELTANPRSTGLRLRRVTAGSPAAKAGLQAGDALLSLGGVKLASRQDLLGVLRSHSVGDTIQAVYRRGDETRSVPFRFEARAPR